MSRVTMLGSLVSLYNEVGYETFKGGLSVSPDNDLYDIMVPLGLTITTDRQHNIDSIVSLVMDVAVAGIKPLNHFNSHVPEGAWPELPAGNTPLLIEGSQTNTKLNDPVPVTRSKFNKLCRMLLADTLRASVAFVVLIGIMSLDEYKVTPAQPLTPTNIKTPAPRIQQPVKAKPVKHVVDDDITQEQHVQNMHSFYMALKAAAQKTFKKSKDRDKIIAGIAATGTAHFPGYLDCGKLSNSLKEFTITDTKCFSALALSYYYEAEHYERTQSLSKAR